MRAFDMAEEFRQPFQEAIDFLNQKVPLPSKTWRDITGNAHDRALVVAGAIKQALIEDLAAAIRDIPKGMSPTEFRTRFEEIVKKHGWTGWTGEGSEAGRAWRARVIYETNLKTAEAAGRMKQMRDPDVLKRRPFWRYRHAYTRIPDVPRVDHQLLDGKVFAADDPIWDTIYPPNGWNCSCGVENLTPEELVEYRAEQRAQGERPPDGPDVAPDLGTRPVFDKGTGQMVTTTRGIDFGWDHAPGRTWADGLIPRELASPLQPAGTARPAAASLPPVSARPFEAGLMEKGLTPKTYVDAFLNVFDTSIGQPRLYRDAAGHALPISDDLFRDRSGAWKVLKRGRETHVLQLAETIADPDEIWLEWHRKAAGVDVLARTYLRFSEPGGGAYFTWTQDGWAGDTAFTPDRGSYVMNQRRGVLLYRRSEK